MSERRKVFVQREITCYSLYGRPLTPSKQDLISSSKFTEIFGDDTSLTKNFLGIPEKPSSVALKLFE